MSRVLGRAAKLENVPDSHERKYLADDLLREILKFIVVIDGRPLSSRYFSYVRIVRAAVHFPEVPRTFRYEFLMTRRVDSIAVI
mmetsp:Transcript_1513/g.1931  ORF Transcript_1513/g.1931 Transcript_1513/m.1931 type:complete len:84 (-) Transcript_1513:116-367(-)